MVIARGLRNSFALHPAGYPVDPARCLEEEHRQTPKRNDPEAAALQADRSAFLPGPNFNVKRHPCPPFIPADSATHKTCVQLQPVQDRLEPHPVFSSLAMDFLVDVHNSKKDGGMLCSHPPSGGEFTRQTQPKTLTGTHKFCLRPEKANKPPRTRLAIFIQFPACTIETKEKKSPAIGSTCPLSHRGVDATNILARA